MYTENQVSGKNPMNQEGQELCLQSVELGVQSFNQDECLNDHERQ